MSSPGEAIRRQMALLQVRQHFPDARYEPQSIPDSPPIFRCTVNGQTVWVPALPNELKPYPTLLDARRAVHLHEAMNLSWPVHPASEYYQAFGRPPARDDPSLPPVDGPPAKALFEAHEVPRIPAQADARARVFLDTGNEQTRLLLQALSEAFGAIAGVEAVQVLWQEPKDREVPVLVVETRGAPPARRGRWLLRTDELLQRGPTQEVAHKAIYLAGELARLYLEGH